MCACSVTQSYPILCDPMSVAHQPPLSLGFPQQEYWSGLPFPPPGDLPDIGTEPKTSALVGGFFTTGKAQGWSKGTPKIA